ncbi:hypothetical protein DICVIV_06160 [Dictyocaulus viviparus]|uniref:ShKT domain-containing protein n=1 Tax=Dictyocaulus viviparus TaxID=29172 RepID=A0A0D8XZJ6_DICVI|nr:hypothetical protein DICVIV_06160 [Dictyocaulus viviparus]
MRLVFIIVIIGFLEAEKLRNSKEDEMDASEKTDYDSFGELEKVFGDANHFKTQETLDEREEILAQNDDEQIRLEEKNGKSSVEEDSMDVSEDNDGDHSSSTYMSPTIVHTRKPPFAPPLALTMKKKSSSARDFLQRRTIQNDAGHPQISTSTEPQMMAKIDPSNDISHPQISTSTEQVMAKIIPSNDISKSILVDNNTAKTNEMPSNQSNLNSIPAAELKADETRKLYVSEDVYVAQVKDVQNSTEVPCSSEADTHKDIEAGSDLNIDDSLKVVDDASFVSEKPDISSEVGSSLEEKIEYGSNGEGDNEGKHEESKNEEVSANSENGDNESDDNKDNSATDNIYHAGNSYINRTNVDMELTSEGDGAHIDRGKILNKDNKIGIEKLERGEGNAVSPIEESTGTAVVLHEKDYNGKRGLQSNNESTEKSSISNSKDRRQELNHENSPVVVSTLFNAVATQNDTNLLDSHDHRDSQHHGELLRATNLTWNAEDENPDNSNLYTNRLEVYNNRPGIISFQMNLKSHNKRRNKSRRTHTHAKKSRKSFSNNAQSETKRRWSNNCSTEVRSQARKYPIELSTTILSTPPSSDNETTIILKTEHVSNDVSSDGPCIQNSQNITWLPDSTTDDTIPNKKSIQLSQDIIKSKLLDGETILNSKYPMGPKSDKPDERALSRVGISLLSNTSNDKRIITKSEVNDGALPHLRPIYLNVSTFPHLIPLNVTSIHRRIRRYRKRIHRKHNRSPHEKLRKIILAKPSDLSAYNRTIVPDSTFVHTSENRLTNMSKSEVIMVPEESRSNFQSSSTYSVPAELINKTSSEKIEGGDDLLHHTTGATTVWHYAINSERIIASADEHATNMMENEFSTPMNYRAPQRVKEPSNSNVQTDSLVKEYKTPLMNQYALNPVKSIVEEIDITTTTNEPTTVRQKWTPYHMNCATEVDAKDDLCKDWARGGLCTVHKPTMFLFCRKTCLCIGPNA